MEDDGSDDVDSKRLADDGGVWLLHGDSEKGRRFRERKTTAPTMLIPRKEGVQESEAVGCLASPSTETAIHR